ncbi:transcriptional regulator [Agrobacterium vitis]|uniref:transcriptional regulator n=1 Tax=Agrobacterium vitis TaxID=373 RepID=UPI001F2C37BA|nr:transcriptional regulator [Agrobacterium vitis]MCF1452300.1 transcriptional regulator [Agrobacterium vitis]
MVAQFTEADQEFLRRPHVSRLWFFEIDLEDRIWRVHNGSGEYEIGGYTWVGVSSPLGQQLVSIGAVRDPRFGEAAKIDIVIAGANADFVKYIRSNHKALEGLSVNAYWAMIDQETFEAWPSGLKKMFPGLFSAPSVHREGIGTRTVGIAVESLWHTLNYPFGGYWTFSSQLKRYPGDKGLQYCGVDIYEVIKA